MQHKIPYDWSPSFSESSPSWPHVVLFRWHHPTIIIVVKYTSTWDLVFSCHSPTSDADHESVRCSAAFCISAISSCTNLYLLSARMLRCWTLFRHTMWQCPSNGPFSNMSGHPWLEEECDTSIATTSVLFVLLVFDHSQRRVPPANYFDHCQSVYFKCDSSSPLDFISFLQISFSIQYSLILLEVDFHRTELFCQWLLGTFKRFSYPVKKLSGTASTLLFCSFIYYNVNDYRPKLIPIYILVISQLCCDIWNLLQSRSHRKVDMQLQVTHNNTQHTR